MRVCDEITCSAKAIEIGTFTVSHGETRTRASCSPEHHRLLDQAIRAAGFTPTWKPFVQPEDRRAAEAVEKEANS